ncbi:unnamed protein product [Wickerhamomyces anomalus]
MVAITKLAFISASLYSQFILSAPVNQTSIPENGSKLSIDDILGVGSIDLEQFSVNETTGLDYGEIRHDGSSLPKREDAHVCLAKKNLKDCVSGGNDIRSVGDGIATVISSRDGICGNTGIQSVPGVTGDIYMKYQSTGKGCHTTAKPRTISGAIKKWISTQSEGQVCKSQCIKITHGGYWTGYVAFGNNKDAVKNVKCDSSIGRVSRCSKGGVNQN